MATAPCSVAGLQAASVTFANSNFDEAHLNAASVVAMAATLAAYGGPNYTGPGGLANLKAMVQDFFAATLMQIEELHATVTTQEAAVAGANAANYGKGANAIALLNQVHTTLTLHEMKGAWALLRCMITNQRGH